MRRRFISNQQKTLKGTGTITPVPPSPSNQAGEIDYFNAYLLPLSQKADIQTALNTYGSIRLEKGDYRGVSVTMNSNQMIYGHPTLNLISPITIAAGSTNVRAEQLQFADGKLIFQEGDPITNSVFKTLKYVYVEAIGSKLSSNQFINIMGQIKFDCSSTGYCRNNKLIKHQAQSIYPQLFFKGNSTTPSYGNVHLLSNYLTPNGDATDIDGLQSATFVGIDSEGWNLTGQGSKAMFTAKNMGKLKITDLGGGNEYSSVKTGAYDIDASELFFIDKLLRNSADKISPRTNSVLINGIGGYTRTPGTVTGYDLWGDLDESRSVKYNNVEQTATISDSTIISKITASILDTQYTPWTRPTWENVPDPLGANWSTERIGKIDQRDYIQNLIDTNGVAELPEGIYYIGSTLNIHVNGLQGIIGKGTAKTVIVGLTDTFPLITLDAGTDSNFILSNLTLQGGNTGIYAQKISGVGVGQIAYQNLKYVTFRNQTNGIHINKIMGIDNCFFEYLAFVNCGKGFYQQPLLPYAGDYETSAYVDKTMFYKNQFINCTIGMSMQATRPNNLNAWFECKFDNGTIALDMGGQNFPIIANCDFMNYNGVNVIQSNTISVYSCKFQNNISSASTFNSMFSYIEGSEFLDNSNMFSPIMYNSTYQYIINSKVTGDVSVAKPNSNYYESSAVYVNSTLNANTSKSKLLTSVKLGATTVIINAVPNPYPQLLVTQ